MPIIDDCLILTKSVWKSVFAWRLSADLMYSVQSSERKIGPLILTAFRIFILPRPLTSRRCCLTSHCLYLSVLVQMFACLLANFREDDEMTLTTTIWSVERETTLL